MFIGILAVLCIQVGPIMEQYGNQSTYNLETVLKQNIGNADFYRNDCMKLNTWAAIIDQIYYQVCQTVAAVQCSW